eukprot:c24917_g1_i1 orf=124-2223(+)
MGCALSKDEERPCKGSKGTSWGKIMQRGVTIQVNRSLKATDGGYIAAIFSANYGVLRKPAPVKASEKNDSLLLKPPEKGAYPQHKLSMVTKSNMYSPQKKLADTVLGIPVLSADNTSELSVAEKSLDSTKETLEIINILELMEGLAEEEVSANFEQWHGNHEPSMPSIDRRESPPTVVLDKPIDEALTCRASSGRRAARRSRPKSFSSFKSVEDVDLALSAGRSKTPPPVRSSWPVHGQGRRFSGEAKSSNATDTITSLCDNGSFRDPDSLQRALSFKYMFNDNGSAKQDFLNVDPSPATSHSNEVYARVCSSDCLVFPTARLLGEGDGNSAPSSPEFSATASLKDWLRSSNHPSKPPDDCKGGFEPSTLEVLQSHTWEQRQADHFSDTRRMQPVHAEGVSNQFLSPQYCEGADDLFTRVEECEAPVFDPEMLDSFENAMKHLSKEDWDAVRSMEESPRNFLRLVMALKKSSSNSVRHRMNGSIDHGFTSVNVKSGTEMDRKDRFEPGKPLDSKLKKLSIEKELAFMRQNSLEVKKALAKATMRDDDKRAGVVFYSTTTQTDTKLYEDCKQVRGILQSLVGVCYDERSISELLEYEQELKQALNISTAIVPTIYVKGKYLVGVDSIVHLYKKGMLGSMLKEVVPYGSMTSMPCACRGGKFLVCSVCNGRHKLSRVGEGTLLCRHCSGTGLIKCLNCSSD